MSIPGPRSVFDTALSGDSDNRRESYSRRRTVSGPFPAFEDDFEDHFHADHDPSAMPVTESPPELAAVGHTTTPSPRHTRSISGNFLSRLNFLRPAGDTERPSSREGRPPKSPISLKSRKSIDDDIPMTSPVSPPPKEASIAQAFKASQTRKRKGSLRKTALLGGKRLLAEGRERRNSLLQRSPTTKQSRSHSPPSPDPVSGSISSDNIHPPPELLPEVSQASIDTTTRRPEHENSDSDVRMSESAAVTKVRLALLAEQEAQQAEGRTSRNALGSPPDAKSVTSTSYASTTDEDDMLTFDKPAASYASTGGDLASLKPMSSTATSYFPSTSDMSAAPPRSTSIHKRSPLSHTISSASLYPPPSADVGHDYTETEYWGWVILFVTWLTFTVGMGSMLEIWSWAWDVGQTPYAPPELEDDPTLPIVGYYPALIVLTGVVAWVWITVAWVGMKYFRHAKVEI